MLSSKGMDVIQKTFKVIVKTAQAERNKTLVIEQGAGDRDQPVRLKAEQGTKYQIQEDKDDGSSVAPDSVRAKRVGDDLHVVFEGETRASLIIEDYYNDKLAGQNSLIGQTENGILHEYIPEDLQLEHFVPRLSDGELEVSLVLDDTQVANSGAAVGVLATPLWSTVGAASAGVGAAAAAAGLAGSAGLVLGWFRPSTKSM